MHHTTRLCLILSLLVVASCVDVPHVSKKPTEPPPRVLDIEPEREVEFREDDEEDNLGFDFEPQDPGEPDGNLCRSSTITYITDDEEVDGRKLVNTFGAVGKADGSESIPDVDVSQVDSVHLRTAEVVMTKGSDFSFVEAIQIWIGPEDDVVHDDEHLVAWSNGVDHDRRTMRLSVDGSMDLRDVIAADAQLDYEIYAKPPKEDVELHGELEFVGVQCPE